MGCEGLLRRLFSISRMGLRQKARILRCTLRRRIRDQTQFLTEGSQGLRLWMYSLGVSLFSPPLPAPPDININYELSMLMSCTVRKLPHWFKLIPSLEFARKCYPDVTAMHELPFVGVKRELVSVFAQLPLLQPLHTRFCN
jgi:hypothetical protein